MTFVLTLISEPAERAADGAACALAARVLREAGAVPGTPRTLAERIACDIPFRAETARDLAAEARRRLSGRPLDIAVQPAEGRRKRLLAADMESTLIRNEMLDELAAIVDPGGEIQRRIAEMTARAMKGEVDFAQSLKARVALLRGQRETCLTQAIAAIRLMPGAVALVRTMRKFGALTAIVTGGFAPVTERVRGRLGCDLAVGNRLAVEGGVLTGAVEEPILDRDGKAANMLRIAAERGIAPAEILAVGDGANDVRMVEAAGAGVAFRAKPVLADAARFRIDHGDLTALLYLQGYAATDFVGDADDR
jgi:phosphoserine phosphatase